MSMTFVTKDWSPVFEEKEEFVSGKRFELKHYIGVSAIILLVLAAFIWYPTENVGYSVASVGLAMILLSIAGNID